MNTKYKIWAVPLVLFLFILASCEKNEMNVTSSTEANEARVKVVFASFYRSNPGYQIKINDERVSGILNSTGSSPNPTPFPGGGLNTGGGSTPDYLGVTSGSANFSFSVPKVGTNTDSVALAASSVTLEKGKRYTLFVTDTSANTQFVLVEDSLTRPDSGYARYKFVNLMPDLTGVDLYIGTVKVASDIPFKGVSPTFILPTNNTSTTWAIRAAGGTTNLATYASASTLANQRVYTVFARGYNSISTSSDPRRRAVSLIYTL